MENAASKAVLRFIVNKINKPTMVNEILIKKAFEVVIFFVGIGLDLVLSISASLSFSIIWLNEFEAPTIQYPPIINRKTSKKFTDSTAKR